MLDPDPLYVEGYGILPIAPSCIAPSRWYTVSHRGPHAVARPMIGLAIGLLIVVILLKRDAPIDAVPTRSD